MMPYYAQVLQHNTVRRTCNVICCHSILSYYKTLALRSYIALHRIISYCIVLHCKTDVDFKILFDMYYYVVLCANKRFLIKADLWSIRLSVN